MGRHRHKHCKDFLERAGWSNDHHILARVRGGKRKASNMILLDERRHSAFHLLFGEKTFLEAARILIRADRIKQTLA